MRELTEMERIVCDLHSDLFELSLKYTNLSSPTFIRRFMNSKEANYFEDMSYLLMSYQVEDLLVDINNRYKENKINIKYDEDTMAWIGFVYRATSFLYSLSSKEVYKIMPPETLNGLYMSNSLTKPELFIEEYMKDVEKNTSSNTQKGINILKKISYQTNIKSLLGKEIVIYIDRPLGSKHPENENLIYKQNYGYIKEIKAPDGEYQDAYLLGVDKPVKKYTGVVIAIIERKDDIEDKLVIAKKGENYSTVEIRKLTNFQEKNYRSKIIR